MINPLADGHFPPSTDEFFPPSLVAGAGAWLTKFTLYTWVAVGLVMIFYLLAYRRPTMVPGKLQWLAEEAYGFNRNYIARDMIGHEGVKFGPYFTTLFSFILVMNLFSIVPFIQMSPNAHIAFPAVLAAITYILFNWVGIKKHGFFGYFKHMLVPNAPWFILPILIPIEFFSNFLIRPFTLALRLFANMFAGHMMLAVFTLGGFALAGAQTVWFRPISLLSWAMALALTFLELLIIVLQAYVFVVLTASYISGAISEEH